MFIWKARITLPLLFVFGVNTLWGYEAYLEKLEIIDSRLRYIASIDNIRCKKSSWHRDYAESHRAILASAHGKVFVSVPFYSGEYVLLL